jgi:hypothetical protein
MPGWEIVRTLGTEEEASLVVGYLAARGVEATIESLRFHQEPVNFGRLGEVRVLVAEPEAGHARALLAEMAVAAPDSADATDSDGGGADAGEPEIPAEGADSGEDGA